MKASFGFALAIVFAGAGVARAQEEPIDPYAPPPPPAQVLPAQPVPPPPPALPPPPVYVPPAAVAPPAAYAPRASGSPGYYYPPPGYAAPIYSYPPPAPSVQYVAPAPRRLACASCAKGMPPGHARIFSLGLRASAFGIDQQINGQNVVLGGVGLQARFRNRGHWGLEASLDFLHGDFKADEIPTARPVSRTGSGTGSLGGSRGGSFHVDDVTRDSIPFSVSALVYVFRNTDDRIFNLYFLGGLGVVGTTMGLADEYGRRVNQDFTEYEAHLGIGAELRFRWFALDADFRGLGLARDDSTTPSSYYAGVDGAPVPASSAGYQGNVAATIWF